MDDLRVHDGDFAQVENCLSRAVVYLFLYFAKMFSADSADQPDDCGSPVGLLFNLQNSFGAFPRSHQVDESFFPLVLTNLVIAVHVPFQMLKG